MVQRYTHIVAIEVVDQTQYTVDNLLRYSVAVDDALDAVDDVVYVVVLQQPPDEFHATLPQPQPSVGSDVVLHITAQTKTQRRTLPQYRFQHGALPRVPVLHRDQGLA
uniref:Uncharacterized protein n=1 Tax=Lygus hesperus TaxID=30085 RepID=A0A146LMR2_LYGHE